MYRSIISMVIAASPAGMNGEPNFINFSASFLEKLIFNDGKVKSKTAINVATAAKNTL